jgi:hypothetical protein
MKKVALEMALGVATGHSQVGGWAHPGDEVTLYCIAGPVERSRGPFTIS